jgi:hypothetical protein
VIGDTKRYLGDGVYVEVESGMVKLTTSNGIADTNTIFFEPEVLAAFERWVADVRAVAAPPAPAPAPAPEPVPDPLATNIPF